MAILPKSGRQLDYDERLFEELQTVKQILNDVRSDFRTEVAVIKNDVKNLNEKVQENSQDIKNLQFKTVAIVTGLSTVLVTISSQVISFFSKTK